MPRRSRYRKNAAENNCGGKAEYAIPTTARPTFVDQGLLALSIQADRYRAEGLAASPRWPQPRFPAPSFPCLYNLPIGTRQTQGPKSMHIPNCRRMPLCFLLHSKCNLGLAPLVFGLYTFCWGSISFACHRIQFLGLKETIIRYVFRPTIAKAERGDTFTATKRIASQVRAIGVV